MLYSSFGLLSLAILIIINNEVLRNTGKDLSSASTLKYRQFLYAVIVYLISDILWGFLHDTHIIPLVYGDTVVYFAAIALSVLVWTLYIVKYIGRTGTKSRLLIYAGWVIFALVMIGLVINFFNPILFYFDANGAYVPGTGRYFIFGTLFQLQMVLAIYALVASIRTTGSDRVHYRTMTVSDAVMAVFIMLQIIYPLLPFYAMGLLLSTCLIHVFVEEDEKLEMDRKLHVVTKQAELEHEISEKARNEKSTYNNIADSLAGDYEAIYYINIETGEYQEFSPSEEYESMNVPKLCKDFYSETRQNVQRFAHPDDRRYAERFYYKDTMLKNLKGRSSYSYKYRIMVNGEARYFRFTLMLAKDQKHFVLCDKDIQDEIMAERALREDRKKRVTFRQIAESLAANYDVVYYVDVNNGSYVGYTSRNLFGQLEIDQAGDDFFEDTRKNIPQVLHPQDRDRVLDAMDRDSLLTVLEDRKQFTIEYRLVIDDNSEHTRLTVRKTSDSQHFIVCLENIDDEVKKEREHLKALNTEKELARRDELTGTKNKTAYKELEQSVQGNIDNGFDYLPFAMVVCDINDLKRVNDTKGHKAGDDHIRSAAKMLCDLFDHSPVFRIGGDEFLIFLRGSDYTSREELMSKLHDKVIDNMEKGAGPVIASGMSEYVPGKDIKVSQVFERADNLMYSDKKGLKSDRGGI